MKITFGSVIVVCLLIEVSLAQYQQEMEQPGLSPEDCYYIDTYKTDFGPSDELVRSERSFFKKLFKNWGKRLSDCVPCCQNNAEYSASSVPSGNGDYNANGNYDNNNYQENDQYNEPAYTPPDTVPGRHGMIYLPLPHPHRIMNHLHGYFNRPFRRGGKTSLYGGYLAQDAYGEQKPAAGPVEEANAPAYEEPAPVEEVKPTYPEKSEYSSVDEVKPKYSEKQDYSGSAESSEDKKDDYEEVKKSDNSYAVAQPQVTPQIVQSIVPIVVPPVYIYTPQYYSPPVPHGQSLVYQSPAPAPAPAAPPTSTYSAPAPSSYSPPDASYSPPASSYSPSPPAPSYSLPDTEPSSPSYSPPTESYTPPSSSYSAPSPPYLETYSSLVNPSNCSPSPNYFKRTYSTSLTYLLPPTPPCSNAPSYSHYDSDQPMRSCPELFTSYGDDLGSSHPY